MAHPPRPVSAVDDRFCPVILSPLSVFLWRLAQALAPQRKPAPSTVHRPSPSSLLSPPLNSTVRHRKPLALSEALASSMPQQDKGCFNQLRFSSALPLQVHPSRHPIPNHPAAVPHHSSPRSRCSDLPVDHHHHSSTPDTGSLPTLSIEQGYRHVIASFNNHGGDRYRAPAPLLTRSWGC